MKILTSSLLLATSLFAGSSFLGENKNSNKELIGYYNDGVYDTISQITKEIEEGVNKEQIKDTTGKIAIITPLNNVSTVNLIFFKTTAAKVNLFNAMTVIDENGSSYLLWDLKQREIDSQYIIQKLTERNIPASSKLLSSENKYYREPVLIKEFIDKIIHNIKNVDTKVVVVEDKIYLNEEIKKVVALDVIEKTVYKQKVPENNDYTKEKVSKEVIHNVASFEKNTSDASRNLVIKRDSEILYKSKKIVKGLLLDRFIVESLRMEETNNLMRYFVAYKEDNSGGEYLLYTRQKETNKSKQTQYVKSIEEKKAIKPQSSKLAMYRCDFKNIKMALSKDGKTIKIDSTNLFYNKVVNMEAVKEIDTNYLLTNSSGLPEILLNKKYVESDKYCTKVN